MTTKKLVANAVIAAIYAALSLLLWPIVYGPIQVRIPEAMTVLPFIAPHTKWGLFVGCLVANLANPAGINVLDVVFGSLATLLAAVLTSKMKKKGLAPLPPVLVNAVVVGAVLAYTYAAPDAFWPTYALFAAEVFAGQLIACYIGGYVLMLAIEKTGLKKWFSE